MELTLIINDKKDVIKLLYTLFIDTDLGASNLLQLTWHWMDYTWFLNVNDASINIKVYEKQLDQLGNNWLVMGGYNAETNKLTVYVKDKFKDQLNKILNNNAKGREKPINTSNNTACLVKQDGNAQVYYIKPTTIGYIDDTVTDNNYNFNNPYKNYDCSFNNVDNDAVSDYVSFKLPEFLSVYEKILKIINILFKLLPY